MRKRRMGLSVVAGVVFFAGVLSGCRSVPPMAILDEEAAPPSEMRLLPGDEIDISFFGAPDLNLVQRIGRDGRIGLRLLSDQMMAAGKTVAELQRELVNRYKGQIQIQSVSVILRTGPAVIVNGSVLKPGRVELTRPMTALEAVMEAGGFDMVRADVRGVVVIRHVGTEYRGYRLDMGPALAGESGRAFYLQPRDIVYVPAAGMW